MLGIRDVDNLLMITVMNKSQNFAHFSSPLFINVHVHSVVSTGLVMRRVAKNMNKGILN